MKILLFIHFLLFTLGLTRANEGTDLRKCVGSTCTITKIVQNKSMPNDVVMVVSFNCPKNNCAIQNIKVKTGSRNEVPVKLDKENNFTYVFKPGRFHVKFSGTDFDPALTDTLLFKAQTKIFITVNFAEVQEQCLKPVIYLYPQKTSFVNIQLDFMGDLGLTYPAYKKEGWYVKAKPDGTIEADEKKCNYLFWDGKMDLSTIKTNYSDGFVLKKENLVALFESTLSEVGLSSKETEDFITFWAPQMINYQETYIHFLFTSEYDQLATVNVSPRPDNILRLYLLWSPVNSSTSLTLTPQEIPKFKREGFTYVEWGGSKYEDLIKKL